MPLINVVWKVPASDEADVDAFWKGHEEWMRTCLSRDTPETDVWPEDGPRAFHIARDPPFVVVVVAVVVYVRQALTPCAY